MTSFRQEKNLDISFGICSKRELDQFLCQFYTSLCLKKPCVVYSHSSYLAARAAIQRHVRVLKPPFNLFQDDEFNEQSNDVLDAILVQKKKDGSFREVQHKEPLSAEDAATLAEYFEDVLTANDPRKLTQYTWFVLTIHFCLRGQELQSSLRKCDLIFEEEQA